MIFIEIMVNKFRLNSLSYLFFFVSFNENYFFLFKLVNMFKEKINNDKYLHVNVIERNLYEWVIFFLSKKRGNFYFYYCSFLKIMNGIFFYEIFVLIKNKNTNVC